MLSRGKGLLASLAGFAAPDPACARSRWGHSGDERTCVGEKLTGQRTGRLSLMGMMETLAGGKGGLGGPWTKRWGLAAQA